jgi:hypothetical protein
VKLGGIRKEAVVAFFKEPSLNSPKELRKIKTRITGCALESYVSFPYNVCQRQAAVVPKGGITRLIVARSSCVIFNLGVEFGRIRRPLPFFLLENKA